jgi:hypothetical protein
LQGTPLAQVLVLGELPPAENLLEASDSVCGLEPDAREELRSALLNEFRAHLRAPQVKKALALLKQASGMPRCRFDIEYEVSPAIMLSHLGEVRSLGRFLTATALVKAEAGEMEAAWTCVRQQWQLGDHLRDEPFMISQFVRIAVFAIADKAMKELAEAGLPPAKAARVLDQLLDRVEDPAPWAGAIHGDRLIEGAWLLDLGPAELATSLGKLGHMENPPVLTTEQFAAQRAAYERGLIRAAALMNLPYHQAKGQLAETMAVLRGPAGPTMLGPFIPPAEAYWGSVASCQAMARVTRIGLRLKAHRAKHGSYPATLAVLDLADIPAERRIDPFTGRALIYRTKGRGFILYSLGPDAIDNGGKERQGYEKNGFDLVWRAKQ